MNNEKIIEQLEKILEECDYGLYETCSTSDYDACTRRIKKIANKLIKELEKNAWQNQVFVLL